MPYQFLYHPLIDKEDLPKIPKNMRNRIKNAIEKRLLNEPILAGKPLRQSLKGHRKMRVGDYRVIYKMENDIIIILKIGHRNEVYQTVFSRIGYG